MGPGRKIAISKMVNDGDLQWSFEYDTEGCTCSYPHLFTLSSHNKIIPAVEAPGCYREQAVSIGAGKVVMESCLLDENRANKLEKTVIEWEVLDNDNLKMRCVYNCNDLSDIQISFSSQAERIWVWERFWVLKKWTEYGLIYEDSQYQQFAIYWLE